MPARLIRLTLAGCLIASLMSGSALTVELQSSWLEKDVHQVRFGTTLAAGEVGSDGGSSTLVAASDENGGSAETGPRVRKSPFKAFLLSAVLPGAGQYYLGHRLKALVFLGIEASAWGIRSRLQSEGHSRTWDFQTFNDAHWHKADYELYLGYTYEGLTDDTLIPDPEISHHLPNTKTQQYYEMTGKYNQFSWGWDDANYNGDSLSDYTGEVGSRPPRILGDASTPESKNRNAYEEMRHKANQRYSVARNMVAVAIVNHLASGFEALFSSRRHNERVGSEDAVFARIKLQASLKSYAAKRDTPFVQLSFKF